MLEKSRVPNKPTVLKLRSDRIWEKTGEPCGFLWHFGHFMHDFVMPFADWMAENEVSPDSIELIIEDIPEQGLGNFITYLQPLFGIQARQVDSQTFQQTAGTELILKAYLFGPFEKKTIENVHKLILPRFDLTPSNDQPDILLIERSIAKLGYEEDANLPLGAKITGTNRRKIANHQELVAALQDRFGSRFRNLVLEELSISQQIQLFYHANIVIGQHGAGLNNLLWMQEGRKMLVEVSTTDNRVFENLCATRSYRYITVAKPAAKQARVNAVHLVSLLEAWLAGSQASSQQPQ